MRMRIWVLALAFLVMAPMAMAESVKVGSYNVSFNMNQAHEVALIPYGNSIYVAIKEFETGSILQKNKDKIGSNSWMQYRITAKKTSNSNRTIKERIDDANKRAQKLLNKSGLKLSVAESLTGGMIGSTITSLSGSSEYFIGGIIAYNNSVKESLLGVSSDVLTRHGAVSLETVTAMAEGVNRLLQTNCAIAVSGVAGPRGGTPEKPVGLVCFAICIPGKMEVFESRFTGDRDSVRQQTVAKALETLCELLENRVQVVTDEKTDQKIKNFERGLFIGHFEPYNLGYQMMVEEIAEGTEVVV
jgi:nicotinamide-nucleotide amidase